MKQTKHMFYTAAEAAELLGITNATLYSYVSRGVIRSENGPGKSRRYSAADIDALLTKKDFRKHPEHIAATSLYWGAPTLETKLTYIDGKDVYYKGRQVTELAGAYTFEEVASFLWTDSFSAVKITDSSTVLLQKAEELTHTNTIFSAVDIIDKIQSLLPVIGSLDPVAYETSPNVIMRIGAEIIVLETAIVTGSFASGGTIAERLCAAWHGNIADEIKNTLNTALILIADHELNISAFTARCAASAGTTPYRSVTAALSAFQGTKHGAAVERVAAFFAAAASAPSVAEAISAALRRGEIIPGFGHPLYPEGDPRAAYLLGQLEQTHSADPALERIRAVCAYMETTLGTHPNIDLALYALAQAIGAPADAPKLLFVIGRTAGWIAHILEQTAAGALIRPRAKYTGVIPAVDQVK